MEINKKINVLGWLYTGASVSYSVYHFPQNVAFDFTVKWGPLETTFTGAGATLKEARDNALLEASKYMW